ncbi:MAG: hypothetical protein GX808_09485 [Syntrophomonadaceae bacterium]|jgi:hypothetical protein|nr:hypothetical protein [Syntrophomonadaceae bacterium]
MKKRWGKGDPVNLSDLLRITPVANEIMVLGEELDLGPSDILWIVSQIIDNSDEADANYYSKLLKDDELEHENDWDEMDLEAIEDEIERAMYMVNVKITSGGRFPEVGFKAGINEKEDIIYFFDMITDMLDKLE